MPPAHGRGRGRDAVPLGPIDAIAWTADGARLVVQTEQTATTWDVHLEQRSPREVAALAGAGRWQLLDGVLRER